MAVKQNLDAPPSDATPIEGLGNWFRAALLTFGLAGGIEWLLAATSSTSAGPSGVVASALVIVSIWVVCGAVWALTSGLGLALMSGRASATFLVAGMIAVWMRWWEERHTPRDLQRLATIACGLVGVAIFSAGSVAITAHLIENRNGPWLIAAASLAGQGILALAVIASATALRRLDRKSVV